MSQKPAGGGYTILEVMIFLTVSLAIFAITIPAINQQAGRNEYARHVNDLQQRLQDVLNNVSTGYYANASPTSSGYSCSAAVNSPPVISAMSGVQQGTNTNCIFVGQALQFAPGDAADPEHTINIFTLVGNRKYNGKDADSILHTNPILLGGSLSHPPTAIVDSIKLYESVEINKVVTPAGVSIGGFVLRSEFGQNTSGGAVTGNASRVTLAAAIGSSLNQTKSQFADTMQGSSTTNINTPADTGIIICLRQDGSGRPAAILIGGSGQQLSLSNRIEAGNNWTDWADSCN